MLALRWYLAAQAFFLAGLPLCTRLLRWLPDRGYGLAKAFGLLAVGWVAWLLGSFGWLSNSSGGALVALAIVVIVGLIAEQWRNGGQGAACGESLRSRRYRVSVEVLFAATFAAGCLLRASMPRIETAGGEKWMEIAFLRAILRSDAFPPHDPWLSGYAISYYHFGYVLMALLTRLAGAPPSIAFNLGIATLLALTVVGAYSVVHNVLAARGRAPQPLGAGLLGPLFVAVVGNLEGALEWLHARGVGPAAFWKWLDIRSINVPPPPLSAGSWTPTRFFWWWQASRVLHDYTPWGDSQEVIDEFPAFSFILGDMHPHVLALPFVLLAIGLALNLFLKTLRPQPDCASAPGRKRPGEWPLSAGEMALYAVCLGGLGFLNTWDFPIYLLLVALSFGLALLLRGGTGLASAAKQATLLFGAIMLAGIALYLPFWRSFQTQASGILPNIFNATRLPQFIVFFGPLLVPVLAYVTGLMRQAGVRPLAVLGRALIGMTAIFVAAILVIGLAVLLSNLGVLPDVGALGHVRAWLSGAPISGLEAVPHAQAAIGRALLARLANPWTGLSLVAVLVACGFVYARQLRGPQDPPGATTPQGGSARAIAHFVLLLVAIGALLSLSVEYVYLRDQFATRMNTVFKFYFQAWVLWSIVSAVSLWEHRTERKSGAVAFSAALVCLGLLYPVLAIPARSAEQGNPGTLDGAAYLAEVRPDDYAAIAWLNANVSGAPVVLEAPGDHFQSYVYAARVSAHTGLPTVLGWAGHELQWRGDYTLQAEREQDIAALFGTPSLEKTEDLLDKYAIRFVYIGPLERERYPAPTLAKFATLMEAVYDTGAVTIYRR